MYDSHDLDRAQRFSSEKAWGLAGDILLNPEYGADFVAFGRWDCQSDIFEDTYEHVSEVAKQFLAQPKLNDIVTVRRDDTTVEAVVVRAVGDEVDLICFGGKTMCCNRNKVEKTGRKLEYDNGYAWLRWVKGEE